MKLGHFHFALLRKTGNGWQLHKSRLGTSLEQAKAQGWATGEHSLSRVLDIPGLPNGLEYICQWSQQNEGGVFFIPCAPDADLPLKPAIPTTNRLSVEIDGIDAKTQAQLFEWHERISGLVPGATLSSGNESTHAHWQFDKHYPVEQVERLRLLNLLTLLGDVAVLRPHQPMRIAGPYRKEKGNHQSLRSLTTATYTPAEIEQGLKPLFADLGWAYPDNVCPAFSADLQRAVSQKDADGDYLPADVRRANLTKLFERGNDWYEEQRQLKQQRTEANRLARAQRELTGEFNLIDAVKDVEQSLAPSEAFPSVREDLDGTHNRIVCPWHNGSLGSAWVNRFEDGTPAFHCLKCLPDGAIGPFQFFLSDRYGSKQAYPSGQQYREKAKEFLALHGVSVPETPKNVYAASQHTHSAEVDTSAQDAELERVLAAQDKEAEILVQQQWGALKASKAPILISERRGSLLNISVTDELAIITVPGFFALYQNIADEDGGRTYKLLSELAAVAPGRKVYLQISPGQKVEAKITCSRIIFGNLLLKSEAQVWVSPTGTALKETSQRYTRWRSDKSAELARDKNPGLYGLTQQRTIQTDEWVNFALPDPGMALFLSADCGLGKTTAMVKALLELFAIEDNPMVEDIGYRISLSAQKVSTYGEAFTGKDKPLIIHLNNAKPNEANTADIAAYCIDSLMRRAPLIRKAIAQGRRVIIILDEWDATLKHLLQGGTLKTRQSKVFAEFCELLGLIMRNGGNVIGGEANLTQCSIDAFCELASVTADKVQVIENTVKKHQRDVYFHYALNEEGEASDQLLRRMAFMDALRALHGIDIRKAPKNKSFADVIDEIDNADDRKHRVFVATTSQPNAERLEIAALELGFTVSRHDGTNVNEVESQEFRRQVNAYIEEHQPDLVIITHSLESGISIVQPEYFDVAILDGDRLESRALLQMPMRVRGEIDIHAYVNERSQHARPGNAYDTDGVLKEYQAYAADAAGYAGAADHFGAQVVNEAIANATTGVGETFHKWKATYEARLSQSDSNLRAHLELDLKKAGHRIHHCPETAIEGVYDCEDIQLYKMADEKLSQQKTERYYIQRGNLSADEARRILRSGKATRAEKVNARKSLDKHHYPGLQTPSGEDAFNDAEFIRDEVIDGRYSRLRAHELAWMTKHKDFARLLDLKSFDAQTKGVFPVLPSIKNMTARLQLGQSEIDGERLSLADLIMRIGESGENAFDNPLTIQAAKVAIAHRALINRHYRININPDTPDEIIVNKLLRKFGFSPQRSTRRQLEDGTRRYDFKVKAQPHQQAVWESLDRKWADELYHEKPENHTGQETSHFCNTKNSYCENVTRPDTTALSAIIEAMKRAKVRADLERLGQEFSQRDRQAAWTSLIECDRDTALKIEVLMGVRK